MNAVRQLSVADIARLELQDQLDIAKSELDKHRGKNDAEYIHWLERAHALRGQLGASTFSSFTISREDREHYGDREEERDGASNGAIRWEGV